MKRRGFIKLLGVAGLATQVSGSIPYKDKGAIEDILEYYDVAYIPEKMIYLHTISFEGKSASRFSMEKDIEDDLFYEMINEIE